MVEEDTGLVPTIPLIFMIELILSRTEKLRTDINQMYEEFFYENDLDAIITSLTLCRDTLKKWKEEETE